MIYQTKLNQVEAVQLNSGNFTAIETDFDCLITEYSPAFQAEFSNEADGVVEHTSGWKLEFKIGDWIVDTGVGSQPFVIYTNDEFTESFQALSGSSGLSPQTAVVDFGTGKTTAITQIADATVTNANKIFVELNIENSADHSADEHLVEEFDVFAGKIEPGVGFSICAKTRNVLQFGRFNVKYFKV